MTKIHFADGGYFSLEVQSCMFIHQFNIMLIFITLVTWLFGITWSKQVIEQEESKLIL